MFKQCPVCGSDYGLYIKDVYGQRSCTKFPIYCCLDCNSFWNFSKYKETIDTQKNDFEYLLRYQDHISKLQGQLLLEIIYRAPCIKSCCDVGFGNGLFLKQCQYYKIKEYGFEINPFCVEYAQKTIGINCEQGYLNHKHLDKYDLIVAIGVFEHIETPKALFKEMVNHLNNDGYIYINVPFIGREQYKFLKEDEPGLSLPKFPNPFFDNDVHIIHFSIDGLKQLGMQCGARFAEYFVSKDVVDNSAGSYRGILFSF